ncbi:MAG TPA: hypothetical protein VEI02_12295 [Planctomycetota bacterium]|nr:hypothetical protein [Planctomycetota bacterium]
MTPTRMSVAILCLWAANAAAGQKPPEAGAGCPIALRGRPEGVAFTIVASDVTAATGPSPVQGERRFAARYDVVLRPAAAPDKDGVAVFDAEFERVRSRLAHPVNVDLEFDSDAPPEEPFRRMMFVVNAAPGGRTLRVRVGRDGRVLDVEEPGVASRPAGRRRGSPDDRTDPADHAALLQALFPPLSADGALAAGRTAPAPWPAPRPSRFEPPAADGVAAWSAIGDDAAWIEVAPATPSGASTEATSPKGAGRVVVSRVDGLVTEAEWKLTTPPRAGGPPAGPRTVEMSVKRFDPAALEAIFAAVVDGDESALDAVRDAGRRAAPLAPRFAATLDGPADEVDVDLLRALAALGVDAVDQLEKLVAGLESDASFVRGACTTAVSEVLEAFRRAPSDRRHGARGVTVDRAHEIAMPGLIGRLDDSSPAVRHAAAGAVGRAGPRARSAAPKLLARLERETDENAKGAVIWAACNLPVEDPAFVKPLLAAWKTGGVYVKRISTYGLTLTAAGAADADAPACVEVFIAGLRDSDDTTKWNAVHGLHRMGARASSAAPALAAARASIDAENWRAAVDEALTALKP